MTVRARVIAAGRTLEARIAFDAMIRRMPDLHLACEEIRWKATFPIRGPQQLPVEW